MFSQRLDWHQTPNRIAQAVAEKRAAGASILDLTESNPTRAELPYSPSMLDPLADPRGLAYNPDPRGLLSARAAISNYYRELGVDASENRILLTASTSEAYSYLFKLLANPGDEILSPRPSYPLFDFLAGLSSVTIRQYPLRYDGSWHIDFAALGACITPRARAIVVVNPNNPTGSFLKPDELQQLDDLAAQHGLAIISDEVFCDYRLTSSTNLVTTLAGPRRALTFSMSGLSKIAGLPQLKFGWILASGPRQAEALDALELISDTYLSVATPVQVALPALLQSARILRHAIAQRTAANLEHLRATLAGSAGNVLNVEGGWYAVIQVPRTRSEEEWVLDLLCQYDVLVQPGFYFDFETEAYLVVSLLTPPAIFTEGLRRLRAIL